MLVMRLCIGVPCSQLPSQFDFLLPSPQINFPCSLNCFCSLPAPCSLLPELTECSFDISERGFVEISRIMPHCLINTQNHLLPKFLSFASCSLALLTPCSLLPDLFDPILPAPQNLHAEPLQYAQSQGKCTIKTDNGFAQPLLEPLYTHTL